MRLPPTWIGAHKISNTSRAQWFHTAAKQSDWTGSTLDPALKDGSGAFYVVMRVLAEEFELDHKPAEDSFSRTTDLLKEPAEL